MQIENQGGAFEVRCVLAGGFGDLRREGLMSMATSHLKPGPSGFWVFGCLVFALWTRRCGIAVT